MFVIGFQPGEIIVNEAEPGQSLFVLAAGAVRVYTRDAGGRSLPVGRLSEGDFFGEIATLSGRPRSATVVAVEACDLLELDRDTLNAIAERRPRVREILETAYLERAKRLSAERERASREASRLNTAPACPRPTSATRNWNPSRSAAEAPERP